jgi:hypothetical protein
MESVIVVPNSPGTLGAICKKYVWQPKHGDCPFKHHCPISNDPNRDPFIRILTVMGSEILRKMADAIDADFEAYLKSQEAELPLGGGR